MVSKRDWFQTALDLGLASAITVAFRCVGCIVTQEAKHVLSAPKTGDKPEPGETVMLVRAWHAGENELCDGKV